MAEMCEIQFSVHLSNKFTVRHSGGGDWKLQGNPFECGIISTLIASHTHTHGDAHADTHTDTLQTPAVS